MMPSGGEILGRDAELAAISSRLDARDWLPGALLIEGEAGIGKTTLWRAAVAAARERSFRVLAARPAEAEASLAFTGLADIVGDALDEALAELPSPQRRALEIALLLRADEGSPPDQRAVGTAFLNAVRGLAADGPVSLAIDDVQWLDPSSARVLAFAARRLAAKPVMLLLARRSQQPAATPAPLELDRAFTNDRIERLRVGPLSLGALHRLIRERLGTGLPRPLIRRLAEITAGNPFYALELSRSLVRRDGGVQSGAPLPMPAQVRALVTERLAALADETRDALAVVAAISKPTPALVAAAIGADAYALLGPAADLEIVEIGADRVRFTHPLLASAAYEQMPTRRRRELHARLAKLVADPEERVRHLALTAEPPDESVARALEQTAARARSRGAQDAAAELCAQARRLMPADDAASIRRLSLTEAECALQSGDTPRARALLEGILGATPSGHPRAQVLTGLARVHFNGLDWRTSVDLLDQALLEAGDELALRAEIELHLAINLDLLRTDVNRTREHAHAAAALAEDLGDSVTLAEALAIEAKSELLLGQGWPETLVGRALELEHAALALPADRRPSDYIATMRGFIDEIAAAIEALDRVQVAAREQGDEVSLTWALAREGELHCYGGRWPEALAAIDRGSEIALQAGQTANEAIFLALTALTEAHRGRVDPARTAGDRALELAESTGAVMARRIALAGLGLLELSLGRPQEADADLAPLVAETRAAGVGEPGAMRFLPDAIEALIDQSRLDDAAELLEFLEERAAATQRASALATAARCRGLVDAARGDQAAATASLELALARHQDAPMPFEHARSELALGVAQRRGKQRRIARATLEHALARFDQLGAELWALKARAELARIGGRRPAGAALTPTERRLADLVASGRSNKEAAAALFVTPRTVETQLSRIYRKLGVHSRTELAARLAREQEPNKM